jgi:hypothetical protein
MLLNKAEPAPIISELPRRPLGSLPARRRLGKRSAQVLDRNAAMGCFHHTHEIVTAFSNSGIEKGLNWSECIKSLGSSPDRTGSEVLASEFEPSLAGPCFYAKGMSGDLTVIFLSPILLDVGNRR